MRNRVSLVVTLVSLLVIAALAFLPATEDVPPDSGGEYEPEADSEVHPEDDQTGESEQNEAPTESEPEESAAVTSDETDSRRHTDTGTEPLDVGADEGEGPGSAEEGSVVDIGRYLPQEEDWELREESGDLPAVAKSILVSYRDRGDCVLAYSGYLDFLGKVWGCVVCGGEWVDVCVVSEEADGGSSQVRSLTYETDEVRKRAEEYLREEER